MASGAANAQNSADGLFSGLEADIAAATPTEAELEAAAAATEAAAEDAAAAADAAAADATNGMQGVLLLLLLLLWLLVL